MDRITRTAHALPSLAFSLLMGVTTLVHHLHAGWVLDSGGRAWHVAWNELVLIPVTIVSMIVFLRGGNRLALGVYLAIAVLGFVGLGLYEGGWNHTLGVLARLRLDGPDARIEAILPAGEPHRWFHEITGVMTFGFALAASWYTLRFYLARRAGTSRAERRSGVEDAVLSSRRPSPVEGARRRQVVQSNYTVLLEQDDDAWIGRVEEVPGVNCQEASREALIETLRETLEEALECHRQDARSAAGDDFEELQISV